MKRFALVFVIALLAGALTAATASATMPHSGPKTLFSKRTGGSSFELRSVNPTTAATHLVESGPTFSVFAGQYSPNGAKIAYFSNQTGSYQVYVANADGSNAHAITSGATDHEYPAWSPNGSKIAYSFGGHLDVMDSNGSNDHQVSPGNTFFVVPSWSPDGKHIAFQDRGGTDSDIFSVKPDGGGLVNLTNNTVSDDMGDWAPNGKHIIYDEPVGSDYQIFSMTPTGTNQHAIITDPGNDLFSPEYTADGTHILYTRGVTATPYEVWWAKTDGTHQHSLVSNGTDNFTLIRP